MRTTVTLEPDTEQLVRKRMREHGVTFKQAVNDLLRAGAVATPREPFATETASLGRPVVNLDRALQLVGDLEDDELVRRMRAGS
jgi:hypothetical protein